MAIDEQGLHECVELVNDMVKGDGGHITYDFYDPESQKLQVRYKEGVNEQCATCSFSSDFVRMFLLDSITTHGHTVEDVVVVEEVESPTP